MGPRGASFGLNDYFSIIVCPQGGQRVSYKNDDGATTQGSVRIGFPERPYPFQTSRLPTGFTAVGLRTNCMKVHCNHGLSILGPSA